MFGLRNKHEWTFLGFSIVLLETILLYLLAALVLPRFEGEGTIDLRVNFLEHARWFFGCFVAVLVVSLVKDRILNDYWPGGFNLIFHLVAMAGAVLAAVTRNDRFHRIFVGYSIVLFTVYIMVLFARLH